MTTFDYQIKAGDTLPPLEAVLTDETGASLDLTTAASVAFAMALDVDRSLVIGGAATFVGARTTGAVQYAWQAGDTDRAGVYLAEWMVDFGGGNVVRVPNAGYLAVLVTARVGA